MVGGLFVSPVNSRLKRGLTTLAKVTFFSGVAQGGAAVDLGSAGKKMIKDGDHRVSANSSLSSIEHFYAEWSVAEDDGGLQLYLKTNRGLFCLHLPTGSVIQGLPWQNPHVPHAVFTQFESDTSRTDMKGVLERFRLNCLLNMLLKDVKHIFAEEQPKKGAIPQCVEKLVTGLERRRSARNTSQAAVDETECKKMMFGESAVSSEVKERLQELKTFLTTRSADTKEGLFFKEERPVPEELLKMPLLMGMVFHSTLLDSVFLFATPLAPPSPEEEDDVHRFFPKPPGDGAAGAAPLLLVGDEDSKKREFEEWSVAGIPPSLPRGHPYDWLITGRIRYTIQIDD